MVDIHKERVEKILREELRKIRDIVILYGGSMGLKTKAETLKSKMEDLLVTEVNRFQDEVEEETIKIAEENV